MSALFVIIVTEIHLPCHLCFKYLYFVSEQHTQHKHNYDITFTMKEMSWLSKFSGYAAESVIFLRRYVMTLVAKITSRCLMRSAREIW